MTGAARRGTSPWRRCLASLFLICVALAGPPCVAAERAVDLLLVLAVDASGSVDARRFELQRRGYAEAFANPRVLKAIRSGPLQAIAVAMFQWTGPSLQAHILDWTVIADAADADGVATAIATTPRQLFGGGTSLSGAIDYALRRFPECPFAGERKVIDVSGDGANNAGRPAALARDAAVTAGIVINGLPILALESGLDVYYRDNVIGGPGAFVVAVDSFENFGDAILNKLISEIAAVPGERRQQVARGAANDAETTGGHVLRLRSGRGEMEMESSPRPEQRRSGPR